MNKKLGGGLVGLIVVIGIIALKIGAGMGIGFLGAKAGAPDVGDCVVVSGSASDADVDSKKCGTDTLWKVVADDGKCDEMETNYTVTVTGAKAANLCLAYDVAVGECLKVSTTDTTQMDKQVACSTKASGDDVVVKVTRINPKSESLKCGKKEIALPNKTRHTSMCVGNPAA